MPGNPDPNRQASPEESAADLVVEGFAFDSDQWIDQIRGAESPVTLGSIGEYELLAEIGRGAQGIVYKAIQPRTKRHIAIKRLLGGSLAGFEMRARLAREVEAAATLNHPSILTVYGMEFVDGLPVLAMEWVDGQPVDAWSDEVGRDRRALPQLLAMFRAICAGVEHAHERGVIHRDLKPTNIIVGTDNVPRILDFGLAKFAEADGLSTLTATEGFVGTPAYAAPEKLAGQRGFSETRSDVYSLGAVLYRMLTGRLPRETEMPLAEFLEKRWQDPPRPGSMNPELDTELDAILMTALATEPARRYPSVEAMSEDIRRYLKGLPIAAASNTLAYRLAKTVRRHRTAVAVSIMISSVLIAATAVSTTLAVQASRARERARDRTRVAESINSFLTDDLLAAIDPANTDNPDLTMREVLDRAAASVEGRFAGEPLVESSIRRAIGRSYLSLGLPAESIPHFQRALGLRVEHFGPTRDETREAMRELAEALYWNDEGEESLLIARDLLELETASAGAGSSQAMKARFMVVRSDSEIDFGEKCAALSEILEWSVEHLGPADPMTLDVSHILANDYLYNGFAEEAEPIVMRMYEAVRARYGEAHPQTLDAMLGLAILYGRTDRVEEAVEILQDIVRIYRETRPSPFSSMGIALGHLGAHLRALERYEEAESAFLEGYEILATSRGAEVGWTQGIVRMLAGMYEDMGESEKALAWREKLLPQFEKPIPRVPRSGESE
ncbi:MAG: serine/threonine protein kinase [Phycisphaerae bacterium]|nr:serine/threonine protein kinase [Phycisphaerae bacterium]